MQSQDPANTTVATKEENLSYQELAASLASHSFESTLRSPADQQRYNAILAQKAKIDQVDAALTSAQRQLALAEARAKDARDGLEKISRQVADLELEIAEKSSAKPPAPGRLAKLKKCVHMFLLVLCLIEMLQTPRHDVCFFTERR